MPRPGSTDAGGRAAGSALDASFGDALSRTATFLVVILISGALLPGLVAANDDDFFESRIRPVLVGRCLRCHGADKAEHGLRVDSRDALLAGGDSGTAIAPGNPDESLLIRRLRGDDDLVAMPFDRDQALKPEQIADFIAWIRTGALWPEHSATLAAPTHWAFAPLASGEPPRVADETWCLTSIDAYIRAAQEAAGVSPRPSASRRELIRRATYDLTGLPPAWEDVQAFEDDPAPNAWAKVVERLLASPQYGPQQGRRWLDLVRYADTAGENSDHPLPHAWRYRNWVIDAFNANLPYDEFVRLQIAGDLYALDGPQQEYAARVVATGYLAIARRFGHDIDKDMHLTLEDTIDTLGKSLLGLTLGCARCHDHKYDPLSTSDYYGLYGILDSTKFAFPGCEPQQQPRDLPALLPAAEVASLQQAWQEKTAAATAELATQTAALQSAAGRITERFVGSVQVLAQGSVAEGAEQNFADAAVAELAQAPVRRGEVLQFAVFPNGNHGADSTFLEWEIRDPISGQAWSTADLLDGLVAGNPRVGQDAERPLWCFLDWQNGPAFLREAVPSVEGRSELQAWRNGDTPSVFVNAGTEAVSVWTTLPPRSFFMHPGPSGPVALAWVSPLDGTVSIRGRIADAHPAPGLDGVSWRLERFPVAALGDDFAQLAAATAGQSAAQRTVDSFGPAPVIPMAYAVSEGTAHDARRHIRGEPTDLGDVVPRKFLDVLGGQRVQDTATSGRRELAQWLTSPENPLLARVFVNRVWQGHFGRGIVATPNDFGARGAPPTHPELLDHLAREFIASGWDVKALHRRILLSATYQTAASGPPEDGATAPAPAEEALYAVFPRRRLTAEELRDALLAVSGELDLTPGQEHPFPPESTWSFSQHAPFAAEYDTLRRSVYVMQKRNRRTRFFALFDGADPNASTPRRDVTTVPTQALYFLNDPFFHARADTFAQRVQTHGTTDSERLQFVYQTLFARLPTAEEAALAAEFLDSYARRLGEATADARAALAWQAWCRVLLASNEFLYVD